LNVTIQVQRRASNPGRNSLNEPAYGPESAWPVVYSNLACRIEYVDRTMQFTQTGERVVLDKTLLYVEPEITIHPEDRITITGTDAATESGAFYIVMDVYPESNSVGDVHHYVVEIEPH
jgi:hypothetical protein